MSATTTTASPDPKHAVGSLRGLSIVLPCFNEAENLPDVLRHATDAAERCALAHEIIVVDDGSTDETLAAAGAAIARDPRIRLIVHAHNRGQGVALRSGIGAAQQPWVLLIDADQQFDVGELEGFLPVVPSADVVVGWRILAQGPVTRRATTALWNRFVRTAFDVPARDAECGFRLARRELLQSLDLRTSRGLFGAELLVRSRTAGARIAEVPVHHRARVAGRQTGPGRRLGARTLRELADLRRPRGKGPARPRGGSPLHRHGW
jgi:glycosyltransferase involved in cell wall biosynthesis